MNDSSILGGINKLRSFPLFGGANIEVLEPSLKYFITKIKNGESFTVVRQQSEWWDVVYGGIALLLQQNPQAAIDFRNPEFLDNLVHAMRDNYPKIGGSRGWPPHTFKVWRESIQIITQEKPPNFYFSVSQAASHNHDIQHINDVPRAVDYTQPPHYLMGRPSPSEVSTLISAMFPPDEKLWRSTVWRKWGASGEIHTFFETFKDLPVVVVGRDVYKNFGDKLGLPKFHFLPIHPTCASENIDQTTQEMKNLHESLLSSGENRVIYIMLGGDTTRCMQWRLHDQLDGEVFMIDAGRGLDPYYREDGVFTDQSPMWGHWHNSYTSWVQHKCPHVIRK
jgi:hypothetical protein